MSKLNAICNAALAEAQVAGQGNPLVAELVERVAAEFRFEEIAEGAAVDGIEFTLHGGRSGPLSDAELLAALLAAGPHEAAVEALVHVFAGVVAEHDACARELEAGGAH